VPTWSPPRAFHVAELAHHGAAPVARVGRRDANRGFQEHSRSLPELHFQHDSHPLEKAGCRTMERGRASASLVLATSNPFGVSRYVCRGGTPSSVATQQASSNKYFFQAHKNGVKRPGLQPGFTTQFVTRSAIRWDAPRTIPAPGESREIFVESSCHNVYIY